MNKKNFKRWCSSKESRLWKIRIEYIYSEYGVVPIFGLAALITFIVMFFVSPGLVLFNYLSYKTFTIIIGVLSFGLSIYFFVKIDSWLSELNKVECISCALNKLSNQLTFILPNINEEIIKNLKYLNAISKFQTEFTFSRLFKKEHDIEIKFYERLKSLPKVVLCVNAQSEETPTKFVCKELWNYVVLIICP